MVAADALKADLDAIDRALVLCGYPRSGRIDLPAQSPCAGKAETW